MKTIFYYIKSWLYKSILLLIKIIHYIAPNLFLKVFGIIIIVVPVTILMYYLVLLPIHWFPESILDTLDSDLVPAITKKDSLDPGLQDYIKNWYELSKQYQSVTSLVDLARKDSIYLALDFRDSTFNLMIKGVNVRRCKLTEFQISNSIKVLRKGGLFHAWAGKPFKLEKVWASVEKSPIKVKTAPKDTIEAMKFMMEPALPPVQDVHVSLRFDRQLVLHISQEQLTTWRNYKKRLTYEWEWLKVAVGETLQQLKEGGRGKPVMWIDIEIPRNDALAIYRAIPRSANLVIIY